MSATNVFDVDMTIHGSPSCRGERACDVPLPHDSEVDVKIDMLKQHVDEVEREGSLKAGRIALC